MTRKLIRFLLLALAASLMLALVPSVNPVATANITHPLDNSLLLMFSSHMRINGEVESAHLPDGHLLALSQQAGAINELDVLIQLTRDQIANLRASDDYAPDLETRLIRELEDKVIDLQQRAAKLVTKRTPPRRRGGLVGFIKRGFKGVGRATGWLLGKTMEGAGKVVEFAIKDVAPKVLKEAILGGAPMSSALIRRVTRELLINRGGEAILRRQARRAERVKVMTKDEAIALATVEDDLMEAFEEGEEDESTPSTQGVLVYEFTKADSANYEDATVGFTWAGMGDEFCIEARCGADSYTVHLEFDLDAMTVSGWMTGSGEDITQNITENFSDWDVQGDFQTTFSDIPLVPSNNPAVAWAFTGEGLSTVSFGGTVRCSWIDPDQQSEGWQHYFVEDQISLAAHPTQIVGFVYVPTDGRGLRIETFTDPVDEFSNFIRLTVNKTIDLPGP